MKIHIIIQVNKMPTTVEIKGQFEDKIKRLIDVGLYSSVAEVVRDAVRHMMKEYDEKELAVELYKQEKVSLAKAAEIAGISFNNMKEMLVEKGINPNLGVEDSIALRKDYMILKGE